MPTCTHRTAITSPGAAGQQDGDAWRLVLDEPDSAVSREAEPEAAAAAAAAAATARPPSASRSHSQLPRHTASAFFPPFYNRPPTPLPPSPSLTSLLRPSFSGATSRRTTPESSDTDVPAGSIAAVHGASTGSASTARLASSARHAPTVPRASPKVPTYEYYGFALYLGSSAAFLMYILWAYVPAPLLHQMGIHYYPNRWWALAVPCWLAVLVMYIFVALASYNTRYLTLPLYSCETLVDECAQIATVDPGTRNIVRRAFTSAGKHSSEDQHVFSSPMASSIRSGPLPMYQFDTSRDVEWQRLWSTGTDAVLDVPIGGVCELLYGCEEY
ncbi:hypothetical protein ACN47E_001035 [Coniothyrium glycines]